MKKILFLFTALLVQLSAWATDPNGSGTAADPYQITSLADLNWFAQQVNGGNTAICGKLMNNIGDKTMTAGKMYSNITGSDGTMIGTSTNKYSGTFDGNHYTIYLSFSDYLIQENTPIALFRYISGATIKDLNVYGEILIKYSQYAGGIVGYCDNSTITRCTSDVEVSSSYTGAGYDGGVVGHVVSQSTLKDLMFIGRLYVKSDNATTTDCASIIGKSDVAQTLENVFYDATATGSHFNYKQDTEQATDGCATFATGSNVTLKNCFYTQAFGTVQGTEADFTDLYLGKMCWELNNEVCDGTQAWYQTIGSSNLTFVKKDDGTNTVYGGDLACCPPYASLKYSNKTHAWGEYANGVRSCTNSGCSEVAYQPCSYDDETETYSIDNIGNLIWFAEQVNAGDNKINGKLTADISLGTNQIMIGTKDITYGGVFDGNGHTITVGYTATEKYTGLFRYVNDATIKNLTTAGTISTAYKFAAGIVARCEGNTSIGHCQSSVAITSTVEGDGTHGGIVADNEGTTVNLTNVLFNGQLLGSKTTNCGGLIGWTSVKATLKGCLFAPSAAVTFSTSGSYTLSRGNNLTITNCYYKTAFGAAQGTEATSDKLASGEVCYGLNGNTSEGDLTWYQNIDNGQTVDAEPLWDSTHGIVYGGGLACPTTKTYSNNTHSSISTYNSDGFGYCSASGCGVLTGSLEPGTLVEGTTDTYCISNKGNLLWFAEQVNSGNTTINGRLTTNISLDGYQTMIGTETNKYEGTFDGCGNTITVNYTAKANYTALFRYVNGATFKNLITAGTVNTGYKFAAGIVAYSTGTTNITGCQSCITINSTHADNGTHGGIMADNEGAQVNLTNVLFNGKLLGTTTTCCGGLIGYTYRKATITNCLFAPAELTFATDWSANMSRAYNDNDITINNSYYTINFDYFCSQGTLASTADLTSGNICYILNGSKSDASIGWYQTIGTDAVPCPFVSGHGIVYSGTEACPYSDGTTYSNKTHVIAYDSNGVGSCTDTNCRSSVISQEEPTLTDGYYQIASIGNFIWFANKVNAGNTSYNAKLTANIDLGTYQTMIGTSTYKYAGTFDGDNHTITVNYTPSEDVCALFRYADGATIKNLGTTGTITTTSRNNGKQLAGIAGMCGAVTLDHVHSNVTINSTFNGDSSDGGLVADISGASTISNSYFDGKLLGSSTTCCGGLIGWKADAHVTIKSSYVNIQEITVSTSGCKTIARGGYNLTLNNCFYVTALGTTQGTQVGAEEVANGALCYALNGYQSTSNLAWYQNVNNGQTADAAPVWDSTHGIVYGGGNVCPTSLTYSNIQNHNISSSYHNGIKGCTNAGCTYASEFEPATLTDNYYQIANKGNLIWFANQVNAGNTAYNAKLTVDIDLDGFQTMIGTSTNKYGGIFDGDNHTITVNYTPSEDVCALFRYADGATIRNLGTTGTITTTSRLKGKQLAGIAGICGAVTLDHVHSNVTINSAYGGDSSDGGLVAEISNTSTISKSYFDGKLLGSSTKCCGGLVGWIGDASLTINSSYVNIQEITVNTSGCKTFARGGSNLTLNNCCYVNAPGTVQGIYIASEGVAAGALCYALNGYQSTSNLAWYQNVNNGQTADAAPVWDSTHGVVYGGIDACPMTNGFSNNTHTSAGTPSDGYTTCSVCGGIVVEGTPETELVDGETYFVIKNKGNFIWFANQANTIDGDMNARLAADIDLGTLNVVIGTSANSYSGKFNGDNHTITVGYNANIDHLALFSYIDYAEIKNLNVTGTLSTSGEYAGGVVGKMGWSSKLINVMSSVAITSTTSDVAFCGGLVGMMEYSSTIENCAFVGKLLGSTAHYGGQLVGYVDYGESTIRNCYAYASSVTMIGVNAMIGYIDDDVETSNCYYVTDDATVVSDYGTRVPTSELTSGALCWKLNCGNTTDQAWYQTLSSDAYPVLNSTHGVVYGGDAVCPYVANNPSYSNTTHSNGTGGYDENGEIICNVSGCSGKSYESATWNGSSYDIANRGNLIWYAEKVNTGEFGYSQPANLTADIDMGTNQTMIGTEAHPFAAEFHGNNHTITVHYITDADYAALFRYAAYDENDDYAEIYNLKTSGTITTSAKYAAGIVAHALYIEICKCQSDIAITSTYSGNAYNGGIVAYGDDWVEVSDCVFNGQLIGKTATAWGGIIAQEYNRNENYIYRCLFAPSKLDIDDATSSATFINLYDSDSDTEIEECYYVTALGSTNDASLRTAEQAADGTLCQELDKSVWKQDKVANVPVPFRVCVNSLTLTDETGKRYEDYFTKVAGYIREMSSTSNYGTLVLPFEVESNEYVQLYTLSSVTTGDNGVMTFEKVNKVAANTPCVFKKLTADATKVTFGAYNQYLDYAASPSTEPCTGWTMNGTYTNLTGQTGMYFIAQDKFWKADDAITIKPFRGWFIGSSPAKSMIINIEGESTDQILTLDADGEINEGPVYNLAGQKLNAPRKGQINIINGKKTIVK